MLSAVTDWLDATTPGFPEESTMTRSRGTRTLLSAVRRREPAARTAGLANRRAGYAAFAWVVVFLTWHVVWYLTGLTFPASSHFHGGARVVFTVVSILMGLMWVIGCMLPLALVQPWGRRIPRWLLLPAAWTASGVLTGRGLSGILDDLFRAFGFPRGLTGLTVAETAGTSHVALWVQVAGVITDALFAAGAVAFGAAAVAYRRLAHFDQRPALARK
jgi:hypothetical protein